MRKTKHINLDFQKIKLSNKEEFDSILSDLPPYSDFNLLSLLCWDYTETNQYCIHNHNLIIKIKDYLTEDSIISTIGVNCIEDTIDFLLDNIKNEINMLPSIVVQDLNPHKYDISEERDSFDYILDTHDFTKLEGHTYKNLKKHIHHFYNLHVKAEAHVIDTTKLSAEIINLVESWCKGKGFDSKKIEEESTSIKKYIEYSKKFNTMDTGLFINNRLIAFSFNEIISNNWAMGHFGKAINEYEHCSYALEHYTSKLLSERNIPFINIEQDTGLQGLREYKMALKPTSFLKKYRIKKLRFTVPQN